MKILNIAYYTIIRNFRDRRSIGLTLLFPIMLILILGTALSSFYAPAKLSLTSIAYLNEDKGQISREFESIINSDKVRGLINVNTISNYDEGVKLVKDYKDSSFIYIKNDFSKDISEGKTAALEVYQGKADPFAGTIVKNIVDSFVNSTNAVQVVNKMGSSSPSFNQSESIKDISIQKSGKAPRAMDYYAVTMLAMTLMYGALYGSFGMAEDINEKTVIRIKGSPTRAYENYIGKILGIILTLVLQAIILILFTKFAYHANWGSNLPMVFALSIIFSMFVTALGITCYTLTNNAMRASGLLNILIVFFTFISGGYAKINADGTWFNTLSYISPNKIFQTAMFNIVYGGKQSQTQACIIALFGVTAVMIIISSVTGRRRVN
jgi:ABC-2 type transport system permease protein